MPGRFGREHAGRAPGCRRAGDDLYGPNQKLNVMLQRILVADYVFPESKVLRCGAALPQCCCPVAWSSVGLYCLCTRSKPVNETKLDE